MLLSCSFFLCLLFIDTPTRFHIGVDLPKKEFLKGLHAVPETKLSLAMFRENVFNTVVVRWLVDSGGIVVGRRKSGGGEKSVREKHVEDIWILVNAIKNLQPVPQALLRNSKRSKSALTHSREQIKSIRTALQDIDNQSTADNSDKQVTGSAIRSNMVNEVMNNVSKAINAIGRETIHATISDSNTCNGIESESFTDNWIITNCRVTTHESDQGGGQTASHLTVNGTANSYTRFYE